MRVEHVVEVGGRSVRIVELTLGEIRAWLKSVTSGDGDVVDALLFSDFDPDAICRMTDLDAATLDEMLPSEVEAVAAECRKLNPNFFAMRQRMVETQRAFLAGISSVTPCV